LNEANRRTTSVALLDEDVLHAELLDMIRPAVAGSSRNSGHSPARRPGDGCNTAVLVDEPERALAVHEQDAVTQRRDPAVASLGGDADLLDRDVVEVRREDPARLQSVSFPRICTRYLCTSTPSTNDPPAAAITRERTRAVRHVRSLRNHVGGRDIANTGLEEWRGKVTQRTKWCGPVDGPRVDGVS
jgi:hypothetical protein